MLYVFSSHLANQACEAVKSGRFPNIIAFHQSLEETKRVLSKTSSSVSSSATTIKFSPAKLTACRSSVPHPNVVAEVSSPRPSSAGVVNEAHEPANQTPVNKYANFNNGAAKTEISQQQSCSKSDDHPSKQQTTNRTNDMPSPLLTPTSVKPPLLMSGGGGGGGGRTSVENNFSPQTTDAGNLPLTDVPPFSNAGGNPLEKMARLTQETLPLEPPLKQQKLGSPKEKSKLPDDQLTPAARQHRHEALQKIEGLKQAFGLSHQQQSMFLPGQAPPAMIGLPPSDAIKLEQSACSTNPASSAEAQIKWRQRVEEHEMEKKLQMGSLNNKMSLSDPVGTVPRTMIVDGKPALMVHPQTAPPRGGNSRNARASVPRSVPPTPVNSESFFPHTMPYAGFEPPTNFCANFEYPGLPPGGGPPTRCFVVQQTGRFPPAVGQPVFGQPRPVAPAGAASMNVNMNIRVNPPPDAGMPQSCYPEFVGPVIEEEDPSFYDGGLYPMPCGNVQPMTSNTFYCGSNGVIIDDGVRPVMPPRSNVIAAAPPGFVAADAYSNKANVHLAVGPGPPMVNNTFVNANLSIHQVNIQNVQPFPPGNIVRVQSMQSTQPGPPVPYVVATQPQQQFARRPQLQLQQQQQQQLLQQSPYNNGPLPQAIHQVPGNFLHDFAEPLRNLDSKVPSQKLQYFPAMQPLQQRLPVAPSFETTLSPAAISVSASVPPPSDRSETSSTAAAAAAGSVVGRSASSCGAAGGRNPPDNTDYEAQYENFQQQLYSISSCRSSESLSN